MKDFKSDILLALSMSVNTQQVLRVEKSVCQGQHMWVGYTAIYVHILLFVFNNLPSLWVAIAIC